MMLICFILLFGDSIQIGVEPLFVFFLIIKVGLACH